MSQKSTRSHAAVVRALQKTQQQRETREAEMDAQDEVPSTVEILLGENPTPQERGSVIVKRLEQYIREGRTDQGGIPFRRWQELAVFETTNAILDAEKHWRKDHRFIDRGLMVGASALVTVGVWGTVLATQSAPDRQTAAVILIIAGAVLFGLLALWGIKRVDRFYQSGRRREHLRRVIDFDRQLEQLDRDLEKRLKDLEETLDEMTNGTLGKI